jgi:hypothetical protein
MTIGSRLDDFFGAFTKWWNAEKWQPVTPVVHPVTNVGLTPTLGKVPAPSTLPRGIRNDNPGNIDLPAIWQGSIKGSDPRFCQFKNMAYGIRAVALLLVHYQTVIKLTTIRGMIDRWAPPVENNTSAYVTAVATACRVDADAPFPLTYANLSAMVAAIIAHENGTVAANLVPSQALQLGVQNALGLVPIASVEGYSDGTRVA